MIQSPIFITGHRNPDADSICATISYARLKELLGENVKPIRLGNINAETEYILHKFAVAPPPLVYDIRTRVADIDIDEAVTVTQDTTIQIAWQKMLEQNKKVIAIVEPDQTLLGLATISGITNGILSVAQNDFSFIKKTPLDCIAATLMGELIVRPREYHPNGIIAMGSSILNDKDFIDYKDQIVITSARPENQLKAIKTNAALVVATLSQEVSSEVIIAANKNNCAVITTTLDLFTTSQLITQSIPIKFIMSTNLVTFNYYDYLDDVKAVIPKSRYRSYPVIDNNRHLMGLISRYHLWGHQRKQVILVDHNEKAQSIEGIEQAEVVEIIDHHRIGDISTDSPAVFRNETIGSTSSIITKLYKENGLKPEKHIAGIMLGAIISDTMNFNSPTCTPVDIELAHELAEIAGVDIQSFASEIYLASASLAGKTVADIVHTDLKEFTMDSYQVAVGQINVVDPVSIISLKNELEDYLHHLCISNRYDLALMIFTNIKEKGSYLLWSGKDRHLVSMAFEGQLGEVNGLSFAPGILSRKKQVVPALATAIAAYNNQNT
ncbi:MAG: putative manganese-dependent inorganic diphosphatase [Erysipelotrichaceae bacterium]|jgi:manganese-dependent inorganic pyrophosphatase|nr:putative manganese-dependent inorganic diphosphatase [Erysipelotrichaceae bacterium]